MAFLSVLAPAAIAATFTVTTTADTGAGSLRDAITRANLVNDPLNPVLIHFAVPPALLTPSGVAVIRPVTPLPVVQNVNGGAIRIDGYTQPGSSYVAFNPSSLVVKVELDGSLLPVPYVPPLPPAPQFAHGLCIMSSNNRVQGLCVHSFPHDGISIQGIPLGPPGGPSGSNANLIYWNLVGTDVTGMVAKPNGHDPTGLWGGIYVKVLPQSPGVANQNWILENVASGNTFEGVGISNCPPGDVQKNHVERCYVGIDITGTGPLGNGHQGIYIGEAAHHNVLDQNWVGANGFDGVGIVGYGPSMLSTHSNTLIYNRIGVDVNLNPMPNQWHGVAIGSYGGGVWGFAPSNIITNNIIAYNTLTGVAVQEDFTIMGDNDTSYNTITQNAIHHNGLTDPGHLGIDLDFEPGVTPNDPGDGDVGANELVNFPVIGSAIRSGGTTTVTGTLDTPALPATIEVFTAIPGNDGSSHGQGAVHLGSATMAVGPVWTVALTGGGLPGQLLTATATDAAGNTSEFSLNVPVWDQDQEKFDYGDAPDAPYFTMAANGGPAHQIVPGMYLGQSIDGEPDGQPNASATGDDSDGNDDEDGVTFPGPLLPGQLAQVDVSASRGGMIDAWIDFDGNGTWHSTEQIVSNGFHSGGGAVVSYSFTVPASAVPGNTFARVRYSSGGNLLPFGPGAGGVPPDGEVEDHQVVIDQGQMPLDFGDAPDQPYPTLAASNGARHNTSSTFCIGAAIDTEPDGQPAANADGDDLAGVPDDEDGVTWYALNQGQASRVDVMVTGMNGKIDAWVDFNADGDWLDPGEQIVVSAAAATGLNTYNFNVPAAAVPGATTYTRVRLSNAGGLAPTGGPVPGEVEDDMVVISEEQQLDFGDAPDPTYPTLLASDGARHRLSNIVLGQLADPEADGQPTPNADGDDVNPPLVVDDEDGIAFPTALISGVPAAVQVSTVSGGILQGWIDWNADGDWADPSEQIITNLALAAGTTTLYIPVPNGLASGATYARFRISSQPGLRFFGPAEDGEVEDYRIHFEPLKWLQIPEQGKEGVDVNNTQSMLADDFQCTASGPITDIHLWGSFLSDILPPEGPGGLIFDVSIWSDVPAGVDAPYSHPGHTLWSMTFQPGQYTAGQIWSVKEGEWWHNPGTPVWTPAADRNIYQFDFYPPAPDAFVQTEGTIYWLAVEYRYQGPGSFQFGWKTTPQGWNDDACFFDQNPPIFWKELVYQQPHPWAPESLNLAFALSGEEEQQARDWGDAPDDPLNPNDYPTLSASNGASHIIATDPTGIVYQLGPMIDAEADGQPTLPADGDDNNPPSGIDDEDGVAFLSPWIPGVAAVIRVQASTAGFLNLWIDLNRDNDWADAGERIFTDLPVGAGINPLVFVLPAAAQPGPTYARFRFTSQALAPLGIDFRGPAPDGEVEDYQFRIEQDTGVDWGDAPDPSYPTMILSNGARHLLVPGYGLGAAIDREPDGQPTPNADGDDLSGVPNDEDGVFFYPLIAGQMSAFDVTFASGAGVAGFIDAWIDFNNNGSWLDPGEQIAVASPVTPGLNQIVFNLPAGLAAGPTFARVRLSSTGGLAPTGPAADGEVEDYQVPILPSGEIVYDFGDAPDQPYPTLGVRNGARHLVGGPLWLGTTVDAELDGQPDPAALGDDLNLVYPGGPDDEDGMSFGYALIGGQPSVLQIVASAPGRVDLWIDWNGNGSWGDPGDAVLTGHPVNPGANYVTVAVPMLTLTGFTTARVRVSSTGFLAPTGFAPDGEVEDHKVFLYETGGMDFGDAPNVSLVPPSGYPTTMMDFGAAHFIDSLFLGWLIDSEADGQPSLTATGDDFSGLADEDGVTFGSPWISGSNAQFTVMVNPAAVGPSDLDLWVDWDGDGTWTQANEHVLVAKPVIPGPNALTIPVPAGIGPVKTYARFRLTHAGAGTGFGGFAHGGEVEDYLVPIGKKIQASIQINHSTVPKQIILNWTAEPGATSYSVYSSTNLLPTFPNPPNWTHEALVTTGLTWGESVTVPRKFYVLVAFP